MDIRLIRNFNNSQCYSLGEDVILQTTDDNYQLGGFTGKKMYVVNIGTNIRQEILPAIKKFDMVQIFDISADRQNVYFTTAESENEESIRITLIRYRLADEYSNEVYSFSIRMSELQGNTSIKMFILDENYIFVQFETPVKYSTCRAKGLLEIYNYLYNVEDKTVIDIEDKIIAEFGIEKILPIEGNMCGIKIGYSMLEERLYDNINLDIVPDEIIGTVNIKQFISDLVLKKENVYRRIKWHT